MSGTETLRSTDGFPNGLERTFLRSWESAIHNDGHLWPITVFEFSGDMSLVMITNPTQQDERPRAGFIEGKPLSERNGNEAKEFFSKVRDIAKKELFQG